METASLHQELDRTLAADDVAQLLARGDAAGPAPRLLERRKAAARADLVQALVAVVAQRAVVLEVGFGVA